MTFKPVVTPYECGILAAAAYEKEDNVGTFINQFAKGFTHVASQVYDSFKVDVIKKNGELIAAIRGSDNTQNWLWNAERLFHETSGTVKKIEALLNHHKLQQGLPLHTVIGHSAGGYLASRVFNAVEGVFHIPLNGHQSIQGPFHINLCTEGDIVTKFPLGVRAAQIVIGAGGHGIDNLLTNLAGVFDWEKFDPKLKNGIKAAIDQGVDLVNQATQFEKEVWSFFNAIPENVARLDGAKHEEIMNFLRGMEENVFNMLSMSWENDRDTATKVMAGAEAVAQEIYASTRRSMAERERKHQTEQQNHNFTDQKTRMNAQVENQAHENSLNSIIQRVTSHSTPSGIVNNYRELQKYRSEYAASYAELKKYCDQNERFKNAVKIHHSQLDASDTKMLKLYDKYLSSQQKMRGFAAQLGSGLNVVNTYLGPAAAGNPCVASTLNIANTAFSIFGAKAEAKAQKLQHEKDDQIRERTKVHQQFSDIVLRREKEEGAYKQALYTKNQQLISHGHLFHPDAHIEGLQSRLSEIAIEKGKNNEKIAQLKESLKQKVTETQKLLNEKDKRVKKKGKEGRKTAKTDTKISAAVVDTYTIEESINNLEKENEQYDKEGEQFDSTLETAGRLYGMNLVREKFNKPRTAQELKNDELVDGFFSVLEGASQAQRQKMQPFVQLFNSLGELAKMTDRWIPYASELIQIGSGAYEGIESVRFLHEITFPLLGTLKKQCESEGLTISSVLKGTGFIISVVVPVINLMTTVLSVGITAYGMYQKYQLRREGKEILTEMETLSKNLAEVSKVLNENIHYGFQEQMRFITKYRREVLEEFTDLRHNLGHLQHHLDLGIQSLNYSLHEKIDNESLNTYFNKINKKRVYIEENFVKYDFTKQFIKFDEFLEFLKLQLDHVADPHFNGFATERNLTGANTNQIRSEVNTSVLYKNPETLTGLLAHKVGLNTQNTVPNCYLLISITNLFIKKVNTPEFDDYLKHNLSKIPLLLSICDRIGELQQNLGLLFGCVETVLKNLLNNKNETWQRIAENSREIMFQKQNSKYHSLRENLFVFQERTIPTLLSNSLRSKRFFWQKLVFEHRIFDINTLAARRWLPCLYSTSDQCVSILKNSWPHLLIGTVWPATGLTATVISYSNVRPEMEPNASILSKINNLASTISSVVGSNNVLNFINQTNTVHIDLKKRTINVVSSSETRKLVEVNIEIFKEDFSNPFTHHALVKVANDKMPVSDIPEGYRNPKRSYLQCVSDFTPNLSIPEDGIISRDEILSIPTSGIIGSYDEYEGRVGQLFSDYSELLNHMIHNKPLALDNPLIELVQNAVLIPSLNRNYPPLPFPKKYVEYLQSFLNPYILYLESSNVGTFVPYYDCDVERKIMKFGFHYISKARPEDKQEYLSLVILDFDDATLKSYQNDLLRDSDNILVEEMLLCLTLGSFYQLGMPGEGTLTLASGFVVTKEVTTPSLYKVWEDIANQGFWSVLEKGSLNLKVSNPSTPSKPSTPIVPSPLINLAGKKWFEINNLAFATKRSIIEQEKTYKENFDYLRSVVSFLTNIDNSTLKEQLEIELGLSLPENLDQTFEIYARNGGTIPKIDQSKITGFAELVHNVPSTHVLELGDQAIVMRQIKDKWNAMKADPVLIALNRRK